MIITESPSTTFAAQDFAPAPAEQRGLARDQVRLLVAAPTGVTHTSFAQIASFLDPGDVVVVNNSATVNAQTGAHSPPRGPAVIHVAMPLDDGTWVIEVRTAPDAARAVLDAAPGEHFDLAGSDVHITIVEAYPDANGSSPTGVGNRLWRARIDGDLTDYLDHHGRPISYGYLDRHYPLAAYQTIFATRPGSAEMPSAARPFTDRIVVELVSRGVQIVPITLHTGVSSQEAGEGPQAERFDVPEATARAINAARCGDRRVVAVGTTVTRAVESAVDEVGWVSATRGWTERVVTPAHPPQVINGLVTGWHDPQASHLLLVEAVAGRELTQTAYDAAVAGGYRWHEFGDAGLLLP